MKTSENLQSCSESEILRIKFELICESNYMSERNLQSTVVYG